jgi:hypothetical protein
MKFKFLARGESVVKSGGRVRDGRERVYVRRGKEIDAC